MSISTTGCHALVLLNSVMYDRTLTVNGVAKAFAMTGWRIGYLSAPEWIAKACTKMGQITGGPTVSHNATIAALDAPVSKIQYMVDQFNSPRKDYRLTGCD